MGDKAYAESMARLLDPEKRHFRSRIVNRSDAVGHSLPGNGPGQPQLMVKSLQQVGISGHVAAVLDDTSGALCLLLFWYTALVKRWFVFMCPPRAPYPVMACGHALKECNRREAESQPLLDYVQGFGPFCRSLEGRC